MRIAEVEAIPVFAPVSKLGSRPYHVRRPNHAAGVLFRGYGTTIVRLRLDDDVVGYGECSSRTGAVAAADIVRALAPVVVGRDPIDRDAIWADLYAVMASAGHSKGYFLEAISGIDIALWDIVGKVLGLPIYSLLGGAHRKNVRVYGSSIDLSQHMDNIRQRAEGFVAAGYRMVKAKIGARPDAPGEELQRLGILVEELRGQLDFVVDANGIYNYRTALAVGRELERMGVVWFEEPLAPTDHRHRVALAKKLDIAIAGGESEYTKYHFADLASSGAVDILQPNVARAGGISECAKIVAICDAFHVQYAPHVGTSSAICHAASLHLAASAASFTWFEAMSTGWSPENPNPFCSDILERPLPTAREGMLQVPDGPGLGIEIADETLERYRV